eukprot:521875-Pelagomonas_calceolata.AAC.1
MVQLIRVAFVLSRGASTVGEKPVRNRCSHICPGSWQQASIVTVNEPSLPLLVALLAHTQRARVNAGHGDFAYYNSFPQSLLANQGQTIVLDNLLGACTLQSYTFVHPQSFALV